MKIRKLYCALILSIVASGLSGCAKDALESLTELEGVWSSGCVTNGVDQKTTLTVAGLAATYSMTIYNSTDGTCTGTSISMDQSTSVTIGDAFTTSSQKAAKKMDLTVGAIMVTAHDAGGKTFIESMMCSSESPAVTVTIGTPANLAGKCGNPSAGSGMYTIYHLDTSGSAPKLFMGADSGVTDGSTADKRHVDLETTGLTKQ